MMLAAQAETYPYGDTIQRQRECHQYNARGRGIDVEISLWTGNPVEHLDRQNREIVVQPIEIYKRKLP